MGIIKTKYSKQCLFSREPTLKYIFPFKLVNNIRDLDQNRPYLENVEYFFICIPKPVQEINDRGWDNYKEFFSLCSNSKGITFCAPSSTVYTEDQFLKCKIPNMPQASSEIWKERILYLKSNGFEILSQN